MLFHVESTIYYIYTISCFKCQKKIAHNLDKIIYKKNYFIKVILKICNLDNFLMSVELMI